MLCKTCDHKNRECSVELARRACSSINQVWLSFFFSHWLKHAVSWPIGQIRWISKSEYVAGDCSMLFAFYVLASTSLQDVSQLSESR